MVDPRFRAVWPSPGETAGVLAIYSLREPREGSRKGWGRWAGRPEEQGGSGTRVEAELYFFLTPLTLPDAGSLGLGLARHKLHRSYLRTLRTP